MHDKCACVHNRGPARARLPKKACGNREFPVATEMAHPASRQRWLTLRRDKVFNVATGFWAARTFVSRQRHFIVELKSVVTNFFSITTGLAVLCRNIAFWCCDRAGLAGRCRDRARTTERAARATGQCCLVAHCTVPCNYLNYSIMSLFMNTVHGHC